MNRTDSGRQSVDEPPESETDEIGDDAPIEWLKPYARRGLKSGLVAAVAGGALTLRGLGALRRREWGRAVSQLFAGGLLLAVARVQRSGLPPVSGRDSEQTTVGAFGGTAEAVDAVESDADAASTVGTEAEQEASSFDTVPESREAADERRDADAVSEDGPKYADEVGTGTESRVSAEAEDAIGETYELLGDAAFDEYSNEVPAPQQAFDRRFLSLGSEVAWGIRESDGHVLLSEDYDAIADREGVRYVASSQIDEERTVSIPDPVTNHWDQLSQTDVGVVGGEDIVFGVSDSLASGHVLVVVPDEWRDDIDWEE